MHRVVEHGLTAVTMAGRGITGQGQSERRRSGLDLGLVSGRLCLNLIIHPCCAVRGSANSRVTGSFDVRRAVDNSSNNQTKPGDHAVGEKVATGPGIGISSCVRSGSSVANSRFVGVDNSGSPSPAGRQQSPLPGSPTRPGGLSSPARGCPEQAGRQPG